MIECCPPKQRIHELWPVLYKFLTTTDRNDDSHGRYPLPQCEMSPKESVCLGFHLIIFHLIHLIIYYWSHHLINRWQGDAIELQATSVNCVCTAHTLPHAVPSCCWRIQGPPASDDVLCGDVVQWATFHITQCQNDHPFSNVTRGTERLDHLPHQQIERRHNSSNRKIYKEYCVRQTKILRQNPFAFLSPMASAFCLKKRVYCCPAYCINRL